MAYGEYIQMERLTMLCLNTSVGHQYIVYVGRNFIFFKKVSLTFNFVYF